MADLEVEMGKLAVGKAPDNLIASAVGSCLVITLYDRTQRIGGMAHAMLAKPPVDTGERRTRPQQRMADDRRDTKYVEAAIDGMIGQMIALGATRDDLEAKLIGGANMFSQHGDGPGAKNVASARAKLEQEQVTIVGEVIGGSIGRSVEFSVASGIVTVKSKF